MLTAEEHLRHAREEYDRAREAASSEDQNAVLQLRALGHLVAVAELDHWVMTEALKRVAKLERRLQEAAAFLDDDAPLALRRLLKEPADGPSEREPVLAARRTGGWDPEA